MKSKINKSLIMLSMSWILWQRWVGHSDWEIINGFTIEKDCKEEIGWKQEFWKEIYKKSTNWVEPMEFMCLPDTIDARNK